VKEKNIAEKGPTQKRKPHKLMGVPELTTGYTQKSNLLLLWLYFYFWETGGFFYRVVFFFTRKNCAKALRALYSV
jgi:hypothetical protein